MCMNIPHNINPQHDCPDGQIYKDLLLITTLNITLYLKAGPTNQILVSLDSYDSYKSVVLSGCVGHKDLSPYFDNYYVFTPDATISLQQTICSNLTSNDIVPTAIYMPTGASGTNINNGGGCSNEDIMMYDFDAINNIMVGSCFYTDGFIMPYIVYKLYAIVTKHMNDLNINGGIDANLTLCGIFQDISTETGANQTYSSTHPSTHQSIYLSTVPQQTPYSKNILIIFISISLTIIISLISILCIYYLKKKHSTEDEQPLNNHNIITYSTLHVEII